MFDIGFQELVIIFIVALLVVGPKKLPEVGRSLGRGIAELKRAMQGLKDSIEEEEEKIKREIPDIKEEGLTPPAEGTEDSGLDQPGDVPGAEKSETGEKGASGGSAEQGQGGDK